MSLENNLMDLLKGIEARSFGGNHRFRIGSNIWGILYLKAIRYGEELTQAMEHVALLVSMSSHHSHSHGRTGWP